VNNKQLLETSGELVKECFKLLSTKGHDYTGGDDDALANFKYVGLRTGLDPKQVWAVYFNKHIEAIFTYIKRGELKSESVESRIQDAINYLLLLNGLIKEEEQKNTELKIK
jgi:hypothetical protein